MIFLKWISILLPILALIYLIIVIYNCFSWEKCFKCAYPIKTTKAKALCKTCKKEGFRLKTKKQMLYEAWEKKIDVEEIYKK
ncbi:hypothetical protein [Spiroplasma endosymbiont of Diplazon laetatorius]|uniref:hypothetical protein n=1 Tax=Spiroplasma endosymbiont of Diplazon laetatorius TaxID=3066322 RepID=UPI0030CD04EA